MYEIYILVLRLTIGGVDMHKYIPSTEAVKKEMLDAIGVDSIEDLFSDKTPNFTLEEATKNNIIELTIKFFLIVFI